MSGSTRAGWRQHAVGIGEQKPFEMVDATLLPTRAGKPWGWLGPLSDVKRLCVCFFLRELAQPPLSHGC